MRRLWTKGYDGIAQTFEKYLKDEMGRASDTVINTAVSVQIFMRDTSRE